MYAACMINKYLPVRRITSHVTKIYAKLSRFAQHYPSLTPEKHVSAPDLLFKRKIFH